MYGAKYHKVMIVVYNIVMNTKLNNQLFSLPSPGSLEDIVQSNNRGWNATNRMRKTKRSRLGKIQSVHRRGLFRGLSERVRDTALMSGDLKQ